MFKIIFSALFCVLAIIFGIWVIAFVVCVFALLFLAWLCGLPVTLTINGEKYVYRWTKRVA